MMRTVDADGVHGLPRLRWIYVPNPPLANTGIRSRHNAGAATGPLDGGRGKLEHVCRGAAGGGEQHG